MKKSQSRCERLFFGLANLFFLVPYLHWFTSRRFFDVLTFHVAFVYTQHEATRILRRDQMSLVLVTLRRGLKSLPPAGENVVFHVTLASKLAQKDSRSMCCKTATLAGLRGLGLRFFPPVFLGITGRLRSVKLFCIVEFFSQFL